MQGGQLASILDDNAQRGESLVRDMALRLLRAVCAPLRTLISDWIHRGELNDPHNDFFIAPARQLPASGLSSSTSGAVGAAGQGRGHGSTQLWRASYEVRPELLPRFIPRQLAERVLRAGKELNFLREACGDTAWVQEHAAAAAQRRAVHGKLAVRSPHSAATLLAELSLVRNILLAFCFCL